MAKHLVDSGIATTINLDLLDVEVKIVPSVEPKIILKNCPKHLFSITRDKLTVTVKQQNPYWSGTRASSAIFSFFYRPQLLIAVTQDMPLDQLVVTSQRGNLILTDLKVTQAQIACIESQLNCNSCQLTALDFVGHLTSANFNATSCDSFTATIVEPMLTSDQIAAIDQEVLVTNSSYARLFFSTKLVAPASYYQAGYPSDSVIASHNLSWLAQHETLVTLILSKLIAHANYPLLYLKGSIGASN